MEHITNNDGAETEQRVNKKGMTAKKKSKKAKETIENINKTNIVDTEDFNDKVSLHTNNGLTNGVSSDHGTVEDKNVSQNCENERVNNCERLTSEENEKDELVDRLRKIELQETPVRSEGTEEGSATAVTCPECQDSSCPSPDSIEFESYKSELQMAEIMRLIQKDLSEPYSIYTYRYFIHNWPKLCFLAMHNKRCIGAIVCKLDLHRKKVKRGYIAMLAVDEKYRKRKIGSHLVRQAITVMVADSADEVVLETEITNKPALRLYENLGFVRDKRLFRYYLNGVDALRLKLWLR